MKTDDTPELVQTSPLTTKLPKVKAVSPRLILQAITVCPDFRERVGEFRRAYQYCHLSNRHFVCLLTQAA